MQYRKSVILTDVALRYSCHKSVVSLISGIISYDDTTKTRHG